MATLLEVKTTPAIGAGPPLSDVTLFTRGSLTLVFCVVRSLQYLLKMVRFFGINKVKVCNLFVFRWSNVFSMCWRILVALIEFLSDIFAYFLRLVERQARIPAKPRRKQSLDQHVLVYR